jgi:hypothetical protein
MHGSAHAELGVQWLPAYGRGAIHGGTDSAVWPEAHGGYPAT